MTEPQAAGQPAPPGLPPHPRKPFFPDSASLALMLALGGLLLGMITASSFRKPQSPTLVLWSGFLVCAILVSALVAGGLALFGIGRQSPRRGTWKAVVGIGLAGLFLAGVAVAFDAARKRVDQRRQAEAAEAEQQGADAFLNYPGWLGTRQDNGTIIALTSIHDQGPQAKEFSTFFNRKASLVSVVLNNAQGSTSLRLDPSSLRLIRADGSEQACLAVDTVLDSAKENKEDWTRRFSGLIEAPPGRQALDRVAFFDPGTDFSSVIAISLLVNGARTTIEGRYCSAAEKQKMYQDRLQRQ